LNKKTDRLNEAGSIYLQIGDLEKYCEQLVKQGAIFFEKNEKAKENGKGQLLMPQGFLSSIGNL